MHIYRTSLQKGGQMDSMASTALSGYDSLSGPTGAIYGEEGAIGFCNSSTEGPGPHRGGRC